MSEDTEWTEILRARGILPPKEPDTTEADLDALVEQKRAEQSRDTRLERATLDELAELEDELDGDDDDRVLEAYRRRRLQEMRDLAARRVYGELRHISEPEFVREVSEASKESWVVCHLFKDSIPACKLINALLARLAPHYRETKFVKIVGDHCIHGYPDRNMPTLLIYGEGDMKRQIVGIQSFPGGMSCTLQDLERLLLNVGAIKKSQREDNVSDDEENEGWKVNDSRQRRQPVDEDSDSDWD